MSIAVKLMRWMALLLLTGCAHQPIARPPAQPEVAPFAMNGRISVRHNGKRDTAGLRWVHKTDTDEILLLNPLGQTAARIFRDERHAVLDDGDMHYEEGDVEALMMQVLGWRLQLDGLHHWVLAMKRGDEERIERDAAGRLSVLHQDGWEVRYLAYADDKPDSLPSRMELIRANLKLTIVIDEWEWNIK